VHEGGVEHRPRLHFDHALIAVADLEGSAASFEARFGLKAFPGGRHPGVGTANAIVPLGARQYLELITVVDRDEAERDPLRRRVLDALDSGATFAGWALRTGDLAAAGSALELGHVADGARERPDGTRLEWRTAQLTGAQRGSGVPFLIDWGATEHPGGTGGAQRVRRLEIEGLGDLLAGVELDVGLKVRPGAAPRLVAVELEGLTIR